MTLRKEAPDPEKDRSGIFDAVFRPGDEAPYSGMYFCTGCDAAVPASEHDPLPSRSHHRHSPEQGEIRWKILLPAKKDH